MYVATSCTWHLKYRYLECENSNNECKQIRVPPGLKRMAADDMFTFTSGVECMAPGMQSKQAFWRMSLLLCDISFLPFGSATILAGVVELSNTSIHICTGFCPHTTGGVFLDGNVILFIYLFCSSWSSCHQGRVSRNKIDIISSRVG